MLKVAALKILRMYEAGFGSEKMKQKEFGFNNDEVNRQIDLHYTFQSRNKLNIEDFLTLSKVDCSSIGREKLIH